MLRLLPRPPLPPSLPLPPASPRLPRSPLVVVIFVRSRAASTEIGGSSLVPSTVFLLSRSLPPSRVPSLSALCLSLSHSLQLGGLVHNLLSSALLRKHDALYGGGDARVAGRRAPMPVVAGHGPRRARLGRRHGHHPHAPPVAEGVDVEHASHGGVAIRRSRCDSRDARVGPPRDRPRPGMAARR